MIAVALSCLVTYLLHSTVWFSTAWCLQGRRHVPAEAKAFAWQLAAIGGIVSSLVAVSAPAELAGTGLLFAPIEVHETVARSTTSVGVSAFSLADAVVIGWFAVAVALLLRWCIAWTRGVSRLSTRRRLDVGPIVASASLVASRMNLRRPVRVSTHSGLGSPIALGRGEVCLPTGLADGLDAVALTAVFGHEIEHLRRGDPLWLPVLHALAAVLWIQPLWRVCLRHREHEVECVCDAAGARVVDDARTMAVSLLAVVDRLVGEPVFVALHGRSTLSLRVSRLLSSSTAQVGRKQKCIMYLTSVAMLGMALLIPPVAAAPNGATFSANAGGRFGAKIDGALDKDEIRSVVHSHIGEVTLCYNAALAEDESIAGRILVKFVIGGSGGVTSSEVESSTLDHAQLEQCIAGAITSWAFPKPRNGGDVLVSYPFKLSTD